MMSIEFTFKLIAGFLTVGILQSSIEKLILFSNFPAIFSYPLDKGIVKSNLAKKLSFIYNPPLINVFVVFKLINAFVFLIAVAIEQVHFLMPMGLLLIDIIGFARWKFMPSSDLPMQRVLLSALSFHYFFLSVAISELLLIVISSFLVLAYAAAAFKKLQSPNWKEGKLMLAIAQKDSLPYPNKQKTWTFLAYMVIFFEFSFCIVLVDLRLAYVYLLFGFLFHFYFFVKHQFSFFFWTFVAAYPAIYYLAGKTTLLINNLIV